MRHSRYQVPEYENAYVHFGGGIEIRASRKTENQTKEIFMFLSLEQAKRIQAVLNFMDKYNLVSIGHSAWHVENDQLEPCQYCEVK